MKYVLFLIATFVFFAGGEYTVSVIDNIANFAAETRYTKEDPVGNSIGSVFYGLAGFLLALFAALFSIFFAIKREKDVLRKSTSLLVSTLLGIGVAVIFANQ